MIVGSCIKKYLSLILCAGLALQSSYTPQMVLAEAAHAAEQLPRAESGGFFDILDLILGLWDAKGLSDDAHLMAQPTNSLYCRSVIQGMIDANQSVDAKLLAGCQKWLYPDLNHGDRIRAQEEVRDTFDDLNDVTANLRYLTKQVYKIKRTIKKDTDKLSNGMPAGPAILRAYTTTAFIPAYFQVMNGNLEGYFYLLRESANRQYGLSSFDIELLNLAYNDVVRDVQNINSQVHSVADSLGITLHGATADENATEILSIEAAPKSLSATGGKVTITVLIDDSTGDLNANSLVAEVKQGSNVRAQVELQESSTSRLSGTREFKGTWKAPVNRKKKAVVYAVSARGSLTSSGQVIESGALESAAVTVAGVRRK